jgi:hypothetical protein
MAALKVGSQGQNMKLTLGLWMKQEAWPVPYRRSPAVAATTGAR